MPEPKQLDLFAEPERFDFTCYVTKHLYEQFVAEYSFFAKDFQRYDVGNFYEVECQVTNVMKAELLKRKYFIY
jgi:hypothetical protein